MSDDDAQAEVAVEDPELFEPSGTDLVVADPSNTTEILVTLDKHDEAAIVAAIQGRLSKAYVYEFPDGRGGMTRGLSYVGVRECVLEMNRTGKCRIKVMPGSAQFESVTEDLGEGPEPCVQVTVMAEDEVTGYTVYGTALEPKRMKLQPKTATKLRAKGKVVDDEGRIADPFARQKALGKAQRNAWKLFVPQTLEATIIAQYSGDAEALKVIKAGAGAEALAELPPPLPADDERANELRTKARDLYSQIREKNPLWILPAAFNAMMMRSEHEHARLEEFVAYLEQKLAEVPAP